MDNARKTLVGAVLSLALLLGMAGSIAANGPGGDHPANEPFGQQCVSVMAKEHGGLGQHHRAMNHEGSLGSHLQEMKMMQRETGTCHMHE